MIGRRIREARSIAGMSQDQVVAVLRKQGVSLTKAGLSKYERGGSVPRASMLKHLGKALNVSAEYFLHEPDVQVEWLAFRKTASTSKREQERIKALALDQIDNFMQLYTRLTNAAKTSFPMPTAVVSLDEAEAAATRLRQLWQLGEHPVDSMTALIEERNGIVVEVEGAGTTFDGLSGMVNNTFPVIVIDPAFSDDRKRFTLAHELGHLLTTQKISQENKLPERLANRFAAAFLLPKRTVFHELGEKRSRLSLAELALLKQRYGVSMQAWIYRARECGVISEAHYNFLFDQMSRKGMRKQEPIEYRGRERPQRFKQMVLRALAEGIINQQEAIDLSPEIAPMLKPSPVALSYGAQLRSLPKKQRDVELAKVAEDLSEVYAADPELTAFEAFDDGFDFL